MTDEIEHSLGEMANNIRRALGEITDGGVVETIQPVDPTFLSSPQPDGAVTGISVWPYPLEERHTQYLADLGYLHRKTADLPKAMIYDHVSGKEQLMVVEAGSDLWTDLLLTRAYWQQNTDATATGTSTDIPERARRWHIEQNGFRPLESAVAELSDLPCSWHVTSGWSIDLFLGRVTRVHHDIDILIARKDQLVVRNYMCDRGWRWASPHNGAFSPWPEAMELMHPRHQAHCHREGAMYDFLLADIEDDVWRFRRDGSVMRSMQTMQLKSDSGIPYLAPEATLIYKSKGGTDVGGMRARDILDFQAVQNHLTGEQRAWLHWALMATQPLHPWLLSLSEV